MINGIEKTIVHLKDDKGWDKIEEMEGDWQCGHTYRMRRRARMSEAPCLITKYADKDYPSSESMICRDYEFEFVKERFEMLDQKGKRVAKHLYFEMK